MFARRVALSCRFAVPFLVAALACDATPPAREPTNVAVAPAAATSAPGTGAGVVACNGEQCELPSSVCCVSYETEKPVFWCAAADAWRADPAFAGAGEAGVGLRAHTSCVASRPHGASPQGAAGEVAAATCDDSADCPPDSVCCSEYVGDTTVVTWCVPTSDTTETCLGPELCRPGTCKTADTACTAGPACKPGDPSCLGVCVNPAATVPCGGVTCGGATPVCCMSAGKGACVANASACPNDRELRRAAWQCTVDAHCGRTMTCCIGQAGELGSRCTFVCNGPLDAPACGSDADCARHTAGEHCNAVDVGPAGAKACIEPL